jgi:protoporphyrinogen oxidase
VAERVLVLGGGIAGLLAAARHRDRGDEVVLVDVGRLGGLLASDELAPGVWVDQGTHVPQDTGVEDLDDWLFGGADPEGWAQHPRLLAGNVFAGQLDARTPFPDVNRLGSALAAQIEAEVLAASGPDGSERTSAEELVATFGATAHREVFAPLLRSWYGRSTEELAPGAHRLAANRLVAFSPERTAELKAQHPDLPIAWHDAAIGASPLVAHYPVQGGCGGWIDLLRTRLGGVRVLEGERVQLEAEDDVVVAAVTAAGERISIDRLVSSVAPAVVVRSLGRIPAGAPPQFVRTTMYDYLVDQPFGTDLHYAVVLDPELTPFRFTLYPNLRHRSEDGPHVMTAYVLQAPDAPPSDDDAVHLQIEGELRDLGVIVRSAQVLERWVRPIPAGFPLPVLGSGPAAQPDVEALSNVTWVGRGSGSAFFMRDVLVDVHAQLPPV